MKKQGKKFEPWRREKKGRKSCHKQAIEQSGRIILESPVTVRESQERPANCQALAPWISESKNSKPDGGRTVRA